MYSLARVAQHAGSRKITTLAFDTHLVPTGGLTLKFAVNALFNASGGSLTNLRLLLAEWTKAGVLETNQCVLFVSHRTYANICPLIPSEVTVVLSTLANYGAGGRLLAEQVWLPIALHRHHVSVLYCPANVAPFFANVPTVVTFQNAAPFTPALSSGAIGGMRSRRFFLLRGLMILSAWKAVSLIFGSTHFRNLFVKQARCQHKRTTVIYRCTSRGPSFATPLSQCKSISAIGQLPTTYTLCISHLQPYKNLIEAIAGFRIAKAQGWVPRDLVFIIAGGAYLSPDYAEKVAAFIASDSSPSHDVMLAGEVTDSEVNQLLQHADSFIFPSTCENCPTALIEAMQAGLPILCSDRSSMPEVMGPAALYFNPDDPKTIADSLRELYLGDRKQELRVKVCQRAREWPDVERMACQTWHAIKSAAQLPT